MMGHRIILSLFVMLIVITVSDGCGRKKTEPKSLRPRRPVNRPPSITCPRVEDVTAPRMQTFASVRLGSPSVSDDHGGWTIWIVSEVASSRFSFYEKGPHTIVYKVVDTGGLTDYCSFSFRVKVIRCSSLSRPRNGWINCDRSDDIYGRTCKFSCESGYWLNGHSSSTCQRSGYNSHRTPTCRKKQCGSRVMPLKSVGVYCTNSNYYGSMCSIRCDTAKGYTPRYLNFAKCLANQRWQYQNWNCDDTEKPKILNCPEGELKTSNNKYVWPTLRATDNSGTVKFTQQRGQHPGSRLLEGPQIIEYQAIDPSGNKAPTCTFSVTLDVPTCAAPIYGGDDYDPLFTCKDHKVGSSCQANCNYTRVVGAKFIQCQRTGSVIPSSNWIGFEGPFPTCYKKACPELKAPLNGALACDKYFGGETCQIHCNQNYDIPSSMKHLKNFICGSKGWLPVQDAPDCTEMAFPDVYNLPSQLYYFGGDCSESETNDFIKDRFLENLNRAGVDECKHEKCNIENVEVTCGPIKEGDEEGDYYDDELEELDEEDFDYKESGPNFDTTFFEEAPGRKRRAITESPLPPLAWTRDPHLTNASREPDVIESSGEGSGEIRKRRRKKPKSRILLSFDLNIRNTSSIMTEQRVVDILDRILNSTRTALNGTRQENFKFLTHGNLTFTCGPGKVLSNASQSLCVPCPRGMFHNKEMDTCQVCPVGTFSDSSGQTVCKPCDQHFATENNGSSSPYDCKPMCQPGHFSDTGLVPCTPCPLGTVQPERFGTHCVPCPSDSSTIQEGSEDYDKCLQFDVLVKGPVQLNFGQVISDWVEELTMSFWIRTFPINLGHTNISFILSHPTRGHQMTLGLTDQLDLKMRDGEVPVHTSVPEDLWTHIAVVWKGYPSLVDIYRSGKRVEHYNGHTRLCFLPKGTQLTIRIGDSSSIILREVYIIPLSNTSHIIADMARSCSPGYFGYNSLINKIVSSDPSKISMVVPSVCSEINRCAPSPCPEHYCRSFKYGFQCICKGDYSGPTCSIPPNYCLISNKCQNDAVCTNLENGVNCTCNDDYKGQYCETEIIHGNWGPWASWSECSLTCGGGERVRSRECNNPAPDPDLGKPCAGASVGKSVCNMKRCPECKSSQLEIGRGITAECTNATGGSMNCSVTCDAGLVFPEEQPSYVCRDEIWVPANKTISCVEFSVPDSVDFSYTIPYKTRIDNAEEDLVVIRNQTSTCASKTSCVMEETCGFTVTMETCVREKGGCPEFPEGYKATIKFTVGVITSNWSAEITQANLREAWENLNITYNDLEDMYDDCFVVTLRSGTVKPGTVVVDSDLTCPAGSVPDQGYCSACAPGSMYENRTCEECDRGWYQEESGQMACNMCPAAFNTLYTGSSLRSECMSPPADAFMLLTDPISGHIWSVNMSTFTRESISLPENMISSSSGYDPVTKHIFFADKGRPAIHSTGPRRSKTYAKLNWASSIDGITVDPISRLIFYSDKGNDVIGVITMTTKHQKIIIRSGTYMPRHIVVDPNKGVLYWIDWGIDQRIERANYDGTDRKKLVGSTSIWPEGLALDFDENKLYWSDGWKKTVEVMDVDGKNRMTLVTSDVNFPSSITLFQDYILYSAITSNNSIVMRVNKDGTGIGQTELPSFRYISDMHSHRHSDFKSASNGCSVNNGGCRFICFPRPAGNRVCACPDGYVVDDVIDCTKQAIKAKWWDVWMKPRHRRDVRLQLLSRRHH